MGQCARWGGGVAVACEVRPTTEPILWRSSGVRLSHIPPPRLVTRARRAPRPAAVAVAEEGAVCHSATFTATRCRRTSIRSATLDTSTLVRAHRCLSVPTSAACHPPAPLVSWPTCADGSMGWSLACSSADKHHLQAVLVLPAQKRWTCGACSHSVPCVAGSRLAHEGQSSVVRPRYYLER